MFGTAQTQTSNPKSSRTNGIRRIGFGIALAGFFATQLATASPAAAYSYRTLTGQPGGVAVVPQVVAYRAPAGCMQVWLGDHFICVPVTSKALGHATPMVINRSRATTGTQYISVQHRIWIMDFATGRWVLRGRTNTYGTLPAGYSRLRLSWGGYLTAQTAAWSVDAIVTWKNAAGQIIGKEYLDWNRGADYACGFRNCVVNYDYGAILF